MASRKWNTILGKNNQDEEEHCFQADKIVVHV